MIGTRLTRRVALALVALVVAPSRCHEGQGGQGRAGAGDQGGQGREGEGDHEGHEGQGEGDHEGEGDTGRHRATRSPRTLTRHAVYPRHAPSIAWRWPPSWEGDDRG